MMELFTAEQMRALEGAEIGSGAVTGLALMERAATGVTKAMMAQWPALAQGAHRALVLCGPGNNGGDGFVIARQLAARGWAVSVLLFGDPGRLPPDARRNHDRWCETGTVGALTPEAVRGTPRPDVVIDAVFGIGLGRPLPEEVARALSDEGRSGWEAGREVPVVAVDCPTGLDLDTGGVHLPEGDEGPIRPLPAALTVTFHTGKAGHYLGPGPSLCGRVVVHDIGLPGAAGAARLWLVGRAGAASDWPLGLIGKMRKDGHKYDHGHVLVLGGGVARGGAARMAARAAL
ncbi:NAD(P)H-hydrate epimerase, partial [Salipiger mucosus]|uniref:NAD(P)H-hydrate epimerase n=1 Tax=Salipiger mucosus TaxID=263378 RepID=UPI00056923E2